jgi:hypothetical protein
VRRAQAAAVGACLALASSAQAQDGFAAVLQRATRYVLAYEQAFSLLVAEEHYVQEVRRPPNPGTNLTRENPGGGMQANGPVVQVELRSDYALLQLGDGGGWMPVRDVFQVKTSQIRHRDDRLVKLLRSDTPDRLDVAARIMAESNRHHVGSVTRTINIPTLALMFLHPIVSERFRFKDEGEETIGGRLVRRASYAELARPTLIRSTRDKDLPLSGHLWFDQFTGAIVKTEMLAMDPIVQGSVMVTYRRDDALDLWVPERMEEYYKAALSSDEILATATYSNVRKFRTDRE